MRLPAHGLASLGVFALALAVYTATAARTVTLVDSGELILVATTLGTAHPPGFPVYTLFGNLWSRLPLGGSVAWRLSLMSALFAAAAAAAVTLAAGEVLSQMAAAREGSRPARRRRRGRAAEAPPVTEGAAGTSRGWAAVVAALTGTIFALSLTPWRYATVVEVYSLHLALLSLALVFLLRWRRRLGDGDGIDLALAGGAFGLALGVHHVTAVLTLPAAAVFAGRAVGWRGIWRRRDVRRASLAVAAALLAYLYLPWAASRDPLLAWGDPDSAARLWAHMSGEQYQVYLFSGWEAMGENLAGFASLLWRQATPLGLGLALWGTVVLARRARPLLALLLWVAVPGVLYALQYDIAEDGDAYFLPTFLVLSIPVAAALGDLVGRPWPARRRWLPVAALLAIPLVQLLVHWRWNDRSDDQVARHYVADVLAPVGAGGLVLTRDWQLYAPFLYFHHLEGLRPDVTMVDVNLVRRSWYVEGYLARAYPELMASVGRERDAYLALLRRWERGEPYDGGELTRRFVALLDAMIAHHLPAHEAHLALPLEPGVGERWQWTPVGLTFELSSAESVPPTPRAPPPPVLGAHAEALLDPYLDEVAAQKVRPVYAAMLAYTARHRGAVGDATAAAELDAVARRLASAESSTLRRHSEALGGS